MAVTRPWQRLAAPPLVAVAAVAVAALLVLVVTGGGRDAGVAALSYGVVLACGLVVVAYGRTPARRAAVATVVCAGGVAQFAWALVPWWGAADPSRPMVGTYDWHNQFAAALIAPALLGLGLLLAGRRPWRSAGWIAAPLAGAGVVLSTSRASLGLLVLGWLLVVVLAWVGTPAGRRRSGVASRALVVTVLTVAVTFVLPGPPLFTASASPLAGASQRSQSGETIDANSTYRTEFWRESLVAFRQHPVAGAGFGRTAADTSGQVPTSWAVSSLAHSGPLQALADGGLLLAVPLLVLLVGVAVALLRRLRPRAEPADDSEGESAEGEGAGYWRGADHVLVPAAVVTSAVLAVHALVDTDWSYPALAAQAAIVAGVALALPRRARTRAAPSDPGSG